MQSHITVKGARAHNLKNIDVPIPRDKLVVITGLSGSGKSSLAFDTIYAEGQRRYVESLSSYARMFLGQMEKPDVDGTRKDLIQGGIACGLLLFAASSLQQMGIQYTTAGKAGFITAFYIVFVPVLGIFLKKAAGWKVWMSVFLALIGLYFLCIKEGFSIGKGDIMIFACALVFAVHILVIDYYSPKVDGVKMSCIQFFVCGIASLPFMFLTETPQIGNILDARMPILYAGVMSCGVAYTLQILGQKHANPAIASLLLSMESCFSVLSGWIILGETLSAREGIGCVLMFVAIILAQLPDKREKLKNGQA